jgi:hypothetical protein
MDQEEPMVLLITLVVAIGLGIAGSRAALGTVLFVMTRRIVGNLNTIPVDLTLPSGSLK